MLSSLTNFYFFLNETVICTFCMMIKPSCNANLSQIYSVHNHCPAIKSMFWHNIHHKSQAWFYFHVSTAVVVYVDFKQPLNWKFFCIFHYSIIPVVVVKQLPYQQNKQVSKMISTSQSTQLSVVTVSPIWYGLSGPMSSSSCHQLIVNNIVECSFFFP